MLFLSPRNNLEGHLNVLQGVDCQVFLRAKETNIQHIASRRSMRIVVVPQLEALLHEHPVGIYPYTKTFEEGRNDPCLVLHTTGSTGLPKPITWKLGILSTYEAWRTIPHVNGYVPTTEIYQQSRRAYTSMPLFHTSGLNAGITWSLCLGVTLVYGAPHIVPNASYTDDMHKYANVDASMGAPSIYEDLSRDAESLERINDMKYVVASGGGLCSACQCTIDTDKCLAPLSQSAGQLISKHTRVIANLGATETACLQRLAPAIDDWAYFYWHPTHSGIEMREAFDGLYELFLVKDPKLSLYQGVFNTFPDIQEWSMSDLYSRHPDPAKPFLYMYQSRKDDIVVLNNGEKIAPALMEATLMSDPLVKGCMVVGKGKFQPAVLLDLTEEPPNNAMQRHAMIERLLPVIKEANVHAPAHGKLDQYHVLFVDSRKPIHYLGQGKIQRNRTYASYKDDIEKVYRIADDAEDHFGFDRLPRLDFLSERNVLDWLVQLVAEVANIRDLDLNRDLFSAGIDSLQIMKIARELKFQAKRAGLANSVADVFRPEAIYKHPTLSRLTGWILKQAGVKSSGKRTLDGIAKEQHHRLTQVTVETVTNGLSDSPQTIFDTYASDLPPSDRSLLPQSTKQMTVMLSGSTGSLGSYLLEALCRNRDVSHIVCLNRTSDAAERHQRNESERGLTPIEPSCVEFLKADLSKPQLGLDNTEYEKLRSTVTHIIRESHSNRHPYRLMAKKSSDNQWPVNFNWVLSSFEPYIRGVRNLIDFSASSTHRSFILFVSSVSAAGSWNSPGAVPEEPIYDFKLAGDLGYAQSKLISECLLDQASKVSGVRSACCRVGIVAGPVERRKGVWNKHEYIPSVSLFDLQSIHWLIFCVKLICSSAALGVFPLTFPSRDRVDWLPVDKLSRILTEIMIFSSGRTLHGGRRGTQMYHVVNPQIILWSSLAPDILDSYPRPSKITAVQFHEWVEALGQSADEFVDPDTNPAIKLLDFYRKAQIAAKQGPRAFASQKAEGASRTLRCVGTVNVKWIRLWMKQWGIIDI
ncbi:MAG: hypothetical protein L6R37_003755 [Teloschistes peruensis]|nr:MAG: hypothetical protein L6R37_003755 [Teloschistes peruensis]